ncbi:YbaK/EbsC family protein [Prauserella halophila]|uniref:YbaK/EbsC family protein n=1 Tax=Prauserella halophila TaxID=185641 RepID=A0ABP4GYC5_9PSEU|nr:YbaK/EbsC family protein [Prauserella halophila]MCP2234783.1 Cys-tRNA(Pro) deacylase, prolyl-tRNA editing enzyme YbaK/EbsC [Prauserella halophila]
MSTLDHPSVAKVAAALSEADQDAAAQGIRLLPDDARTAESAAAALGIEVGAIANSLVFRATLPDGTERALLALTSGAHRANTATLAELAGVEQVGKAEPEFVKTWTGQAIGGVAPVGHPHRILTLVDTALAGYGVVWAAAGHPKSVYPTTFDDLLAATGGTAAHVAAEPGQPR